MLPRSVKLLRATCGPHQLQPMASLSLSGSASGSAPAPTPTPTPPGRVTCTLIPGDGVGPEMMDAAQAVLQSMGAKVDFEELYFSEINHHGSCSLEEVVGSVKKNGVCLKGVIGVPEHGLTGELMGLNTAFKRQLDLYASVVKARSFAGVPTRHKDIDTVIVREATEGEYSCIEHESVKGVVESLKVVTAAKSHRIAKFAFDYAVRHGRKKVTCVHKANIMKLGDGLFMRCCKEVAALYPNIQFDTMIVDNTCMQIVSKPQQFDVMVMPNLYGNIIDNLAVGLVGGAGLVAGASYSAELIVFEPGARHTFDKAAGKNVANPTAALLAAAKLLLHVGFHEDSVRLTKAVERVLNDQKVRTRDLGGYATTRDFTSAVAKAI